MKSRLLRKRRIAKEQADDYVGTAAWYLWINGELVKSNSDFNSYQSPAIIDYLVRHNKLEEAIREYYDEGNGQYEGLTDEEIEREIEECKKEYALPTIMYQDLGDDILPSGLRTMPVKKDHILLRGTHFETVYYINSEYAHECTADEVAKSISEMDHDCQIFDEETGEILYMA